METKKADWSDLPKDILRLIMEKLRCLERVPLCLVSKSWHESFLEIKDTQQFLPWRMYFDHDQKNESGICKLYDPSRKRNYIVKDAETVKNEEFSGAKPCDSKYGWVLFSRTIKRNYFFHNPFSTNEVIQLYFFHNPFTNEVIRLPKLEEPHHKVAFSLSPTSPDCIVIAFLIGSGGALRIKTCHPGDQDWRMSEFECNMIFIHRLVYAGDSFYCTFNFTMSGDEELYLGAFNVKQQQWKRFSSPLPTSSRESCLAVAFNEHLLLYEPLHREPETRFWRLKLPEEKWVVLEHESLKKHVFFHSWHCPSFSIPAIENARKSAESPFAHVRTTPTAILLKRAIWIQPPFVLGPALLEQS